MNLEQAKEILQRKYSDISDEEVERIYNSLDSMIGFLLSKLIAGRENV